MQLTYHFHNTPSANSTKMGPVRLVCKSLVIFLLLCILQQVNRGTQWQIKQSRLLIRKKVGWGIGELTQWAAITGFAASCHTEVAIKGLVCHPNMRHPLCSSTLYPSPPPKSASNMLAYLYAFKPKWTGENPGRTKPVPPLVQGLMPFHVVHSLARHHVANLLP